jgi:hypothetical protein
MPACQSAGGLVRRARIVDHGGAFDLRGDTTSFLRVDMKFWERLRGVKEKIVCVSYPKSGRTWVRFALISAGVKIKFTHGGYASRDPDELGYQFTGLRPQSFGSKNIFLYRNSLDTAVSEFHQIHNRIFRPDHPQYERMKERLSKQNLLPPADLDEFVLHPVWGCRKISAFNAAHIEYFSKRKNNMLVRYEDLRRDPRAYFSQMLDFIGAKDYDIEHVLRESSFENMRQLELNADEATKKANRLYGMRDGDENSLKVRQGKVGGYAEKLKPETVEAARKICAEYNLTI